MPSTCLYKGDMIVHIFDLGKSDSCASKKRLTVFFRTHTVLLTHNYRLPSFPFCYNVVAKSTIYNIMPYTQKLHSIMHLYKTTDQVLTLEFPWPVIHCLHIQNVNHL